MSDEELVKHCMCGCMYLEDNCPNCNKVTDADRIEALVKERDEYHGLFVHWRSEADTRADLVDPAAIREAALREAAEICTGIIRDYDVMKPDGKTYEPLKVQKAAKGMVSLARQDILALINKKEG